MSDNNENNKSGTGGLWLFIIVSGIIVYLAIVMPLRIIFKNRENGILYTLMPFGNILSGPAVGSLLMYGLASSSWLIIFVNYFNTSNKYAPCAPEIYIALSIFGSVATLLSIWLAYKDVQNSMEYQSD